jgi:hypothetical protein
MIPDCLKCGSKDVDRNCPLYFVIPGDIFVPTEHYLCDKHKHLSYSFEDVYNPDYTRKKLNEEAVK